MSGVPQSTGSGGAVVRTALLRITDESVKKPCALGLQTGGHSTRTSYFIHAQANQQREYTHHAPQIVRAQPSPPSYSVRGEAP